MNPSIVIGAGGTGKWVVTYLKRAATRHHNEELIRRYGDAARQRMEFGQLPSGLDLFAVDVDTDPVFFADAWCEKFQLDYGRDSREFSLISSGYRTVLDSIQQGTGRHDFPLIADWLSQDDAKCYKLDAMDPSTLGGAGQLRQLGRLSLFLRLQSDLALPDRISQACRNVAGSRGDAKVSIFVVGSVAGGTGSGTLIDIAALVHTLAPGVFGAEGYEVIGLVVLPTTFGSVTVMAGDEMVRMQANGYAALRELMRLTTTADNYEIRYTENLAATLSQPLFSILYLVEGSKRGQGLDLSHVLPHKGTYPAIADAILLHLAHPVDYKQIKTSKGQHPEGAYSILGTTLFIFPAEEMIYEFGHVLTRSVLDALRWGRHMDDKDRPGQEAARRDATAWALPRRKAFFEETAGSSTALLRWIPAVLSAARKPQLSTPVMMGQLRLNDQKMDRSLPTLRLSEVVEIAPLGKGGDPRGVKATAEDRVAAALGTKDDALQGNRRTVHGVLNHYRKVHGERFRDHLSAALLDTLNETAGSTGLRPRRGGLLYAGALLATIRNELVAFKDRLQEIYKGQVTIPGANKSQLTRVIEEVGAAEQRMLAAGRLRSRHEQEEYLRCRQRAYDLTVQDAVLGTITTIVQDFLEIITTCSAATAAWAEGFDTDIAKLSGEIRDIRRRRREAASIEVHRYLTAPDDAVEADLLARHAGVRDNERDLVGGTAVEHLLGQLEWGWEAGIANPLVIKQPAVPGRPARAGVDHWAGDGILRLLDASYARFAPIRDVTIWEALAKQGVRADQLRDEVAQRSSPITGVDDEEQSRFPPIRTEEQSFFLARWEAAQEGDHEGSPRRLSAELKANRDRSAAIWDDPHRILGVSLRHLIKMPALSCVPAMRGPYEKLLTGKVAIRGTERRVPLHLFPGEQLAARLELESMELLNQRVVIPAELISLFERSEELQWFAHALAFDMFSFTRDRARGELRWVYRALRERGGQEEVALGDTALNACRAFCGRNGQLSRHVREAILDELSKKESTLDDVEYGRFLRDKASRPIIPDNDATEPEELREGLDQCLRMLLERHARRF